MALAELSVLEQRYLAVREVLDTGATVSDVATRDGVDRRTLHRWLGRDANDGIGALAEKSSKPDRCRPTGAVVEARIIAMRTAHPLSETSYDPGQAGAASSTSCASRSGIYRCLVRHGLIGAQGPAPTAQGLHALGPGPAPWSSGRWTWSGGYHSIVPGLNHTCRPASCWEPTYRGNASQAALRPLAPADAPQHVGAAASGPPVSKCSPARSRSRTRSPGRGRPGTAPCSNRDGGCRPAESRSRGTPPARSGVGAGAPGPTGSGRKPCRR